MNIKEKRGLKTLLRHCFMNEEDNGSNVKMEDTR